MENNNYVKHILSEDVIELICEAKKTEAKLNFDNPADVMNFEFGFATVVKLFELVYIDGSFLKFDELDGYFQKENYFDEKVVEETMAKIGNVFDQKIADGDIFGEYEDGIYVRFERNDYDKVLGLEDELSNNKSMTRKR